MAFNDSNVEKYIDFKECVVKNTNHDLAIIQFKDKKTPENAHIFEIPKEYPLKEYSIDDNISGIFEGGGKVELVAINYAGHDDTQSFNYGVK